MSKRYVAHIILEAETPLKVGSNASDFLQDAPVQKDWNGLPMILGTSIAGVLRKYFRDTYSNDDLFGFQRKNSKNEDISEGSQVIISNALLVGDNDKVCETLLLDRSTNKIFSLFERLPIRQHTAITEKGTAKDGSKFDEEVVYKGSRFKFSIEFIEEDKATFTKLLELLKSPAFRLGGGSTKGFGSFKIHSLEYAHLHLDTYTSSLNISLKNATKVDTTKSTCQNFTTYTLNIKPDDFFMFGSGFGDGDADMTPVYEKEVDYEKANLSDKKVLIPASSIKGALAHRTTYHYNKLLGNTIEAGNGAKAVEVIFGQAKDSKNKIEGSKGKLLISDCFKRKQEATKTFDHVSIDRFTGGAIDGALFQEKTIATDNENYTIEILLNNEVNDKELEAFECALKDIATGMLPLGGATTKGHGIFCGEILKNNIPLEKSDCDGK